jgi:hypothetical protein
MQMGAGSHVENVIFSNLVMNNVTCPIYIGLGSSPRNSTNPNETRRGGVVRNILFKGIRATVAAAPDLKEYPYVVNTPISDVYPGELGRNTLRWRNASLWDVCAKREGADAE